MEPNKDVKTGIKYYYLVTQFIVELIVSMGLCIFLGIWLDKKANTVWVFTFVFVVIGGFAPIYNLIKKLLRNNKE